MELVVLMGRQEDVRDKLKALPVPARHRVHLLGFVKDMVSRRNSSVSEYL